MLVVTVNPDDPSTEVNIRIEEWRGIRPDVTRIGLVYKGLSARPKSSALRTVNVKGRNVHAVVAPHDVDNETTWTDGSRQRRGPSSSSTSSQSHSWPRSDNRGPGSRIRPGDVESGIGSVGWKGPWLLGSWAGRQSASSESQTPTGCSRRPCPCKA